MQACFPEQPTEKWWGVISDMASLDAGNMCKGKVLATLPSTYAGKLGVRRLRPGTRAKRHC
eukprot:2097352-Alexandrium_andersonii.AAC.1